MRDWTALNRRALLQLLGAAALARATLAQGAPELAAADPALNDADRAFDAEFGDAFLERYWSYNADAALFEGYYRLAGKLQIPDAASRWRYRRFLDSTIARLERHAVAPLGARQRTDWAVLDNQLRYERWSLLELCEWQWNPALYNVAEPIALILNTAYAPLDERLRRVLARLESVPAYYAAAQAALSQPTREHTALAITQNRGALEVFGTDLQRQLASSALTATERALFSSRCESARAAITDYISWLEALDARQAAGGARSFRLGAALYAQKFAFVQQSGESARSLYQRALQEKQTVLARMEELTDQLWPKYFAAAPPPSDRFAKIGRMIERLSDQHVAPQDYLASIRRLIPQLTQWVNEHHLIDIDQSKPLTVRPTPPYERGVAIAGIEAPGPYDPAAQTYFNVDTLEQDTPQQAESFLREYNDWMLPVFIIHEAIPGHYVQLMYANRSPSRIKSLFGNGAMIEGWAVYAERMMLESGYGAQAPEQWLIYWKWYLRSVSNTILDYGVHVQGLSEADVRRLTMGEAFQSEREAAGKWLRIQRSSVQLTQYFAGFSAIYRLREQLRQRLGARFELQRFHQQLLSYGSAPVQLIEQLMLQTVRDR